MSVFILAAARTPMGALGGFLQSVPAPSLAAAVLGPLLADRDQAPLGGLLLGQAIAAGAGPNPAQRAAHLAGLPAETWASTLNQGANSGLQAIFQAALSLRAGACEQILAGGMESSSCAPYLLPTARWGTRMGSAPVLDALVLDGQPWPQDPPSAEAAQYVTQSRARAEAAQRAGRFRSEQVAITLASRRGPVRLTADEPAGALSGTASPGDGAAVLLLGSTGQGSLARIHATIQAPDSTQAIQRLLRSTGLALTDIDRWELDEADPAHPLGLLAFFPELDPARVNVLGGALALGQPLGAAGARLVVSLAHQLQDNGLRYGLAVMASPGSALAILLEHP